MFKKLKTKMIILTATSILIFLVAIVFTINVINYQTLINDTDNLLETILKDKGTGPNKLPPDDKGPGHNNPNNDEYVYFTVQLNYNTEIISYNISRVPSINEDIMKIYLNTAINSNEEKGFIDNYRFAIKYNNDNYSIVFLNCAKEISNFYSFCIISICTSLTSFLIVFIMLIILANKIIKPFETNYEKQKMFITDASHEIKTPLTIINTNIDILEMEYGDNESFSDIHNQINRLKELTNNLVLLSKMEEFDKQLDFIELPISDIISESLSPFKNIADSQNKVIVENIQPLLTLIGHDKSIRQLISILMDNAMKYSKDNSEINVSLQKQNHTIILAVTNVSLYKLDPNKIKHVFDRFYRLDSSRNSSTGGHGIGLSIAKAIVNNHSAKINATIKDENKFQITIIFNNKRNDISN